MRLDFNKYIFKCPACETTQLRGSDRIKNTIGYYLDDSSDGGIIKSRRFSISCGFRRYPVYVKCPECNVFFKITRELFVRVVPEKEYEDALYHKRKGIPQSMGFLTANGYFQAIDEGLFNGNEIDILKLRVLLWRKMNRSIMPSIIMPSKTNNKTEFDADERKKYEENCREILSLTSSYSEFVTLILSTVHHLWKMNRSLETAIDADERKKGEENRRKILKILSLIFHQKNSGDADLFSESEITLMRAELLRNIGEFEKSKDELDKIKDIDDRLEEFISAIKKECEAGNTLTIRFYKRRQKLRREEEKVREEKEKIEKEEAYRKKFQRILGDSPFLCQGKSEDLIADYKQIKMKDVINANNIRRLYKSVNETSPDSGLDPDRGGILDDDDKRKFLHLCFYFTKGELTTNKTRLDIELKEQTKIYKETHFYKEYTEMLSAYSYLQSLSNEKWDEFREMAQKNEFYKPDMKLNTTKDCLIFKKQWYGFMDRMIEYTNKTINQRI